MKCIIASQAAEKWNVFQRGLQIMCSQKRIDGAFKSGDAWTIPDNAQKSKDKRKRAESINETI